MNDTSTGFALDTIQPSKIIVRHQVQKRCANSPNRKSGRPPDFKLDEKAKEAGELAHTLLGWSRQPYPVMLTATASKPFLPSATSIATRWPSASLAIPERCSASA
jgi:hypothetical protein